MKLYHGSCLDVLPKIGPFDCIFTDPPDNIGLAYEEYEDKRSHDEYLDFIEKAINVMCDRAACVWVSFNSKWTLEYAGIFNRLRCSRDLLFKAGVQTFTFGVQQQADLKNCHRPLWRLMRKDAPLYPDQAREASWRLLNGDKRADPRGCVPGDWHDSVFNVTRVTGNSKQKRQWHPTQLNEDLVARCLKLTTKEGDSVCDPFGGTGTTLRVCTKLGRSATLVELDGMYCREIAKENGLKISKIVP